MNVKQVRNIIDGMADDVPCILARTIDSKTEFFELEQCVNFDHQKERQEIWFYEGCSR